ncbi:MAG: 1,4-alpha-glucan branching enzyme, partial [Ruminococcaceae bacterium]|nr:1,4-alpha-glucan branching enzyme [Oscillospiraceae bacterium]
WNEWNFQKELDWSLLNEQKHQQLQHFFKTLNHFYLNTAPLWEVDFTWEGFSWISNDDYTQSVIAFRRMDGNGSEIIAVCNFLPDKREHYSIGVPFEGTYAEIFSSDSSEFGGSGITNGASIHTDQKAMHGFQQSVELTLPPLSVLFLKCKRSKAKKAAKTAVLKAESEKSK